MQLRIARHTGRLEEVVAFYRDGLGLPEMGGFRDHHGYDGVFLEVPGTSAHLELTTGGEHDAAAPHPESLLVFYLGDPDTLRTVAARLGCRSRRSRAPLLGRARADIRGPRGLSRRPCAGALGAPAVGRPPRRSRQGAHP